MADTTEDTDSKTPVDQPSSTGGGPPARVDIGKRAVALIIDAVIAVVVGLVALLTSKWVEVQIGATRSYAIWAVTA